MITNDQIKKSIERLYEVFSKVRRPRQAMDIGACPCCVSEDKIKVLLRTPLRVLQENDLGSYVPVLFLTSGDEESFKYFLPRIFELLIETGGDSFWSPEIVLGKLKLGNWMGREWSQEERQAVRFYIEAVFIELLNEKEETGKAINEEINIDAWLCGIAHCIDDIDPFLSRLLEPSFKNKLLQLFEINKNSLAEGKLNNPFWENIPEQEKKVVSWFKSDVVINAIKINKIVS